MNILLPVLLLIVLGFATVILFLNKKLSDLKKQNTDQSLIEWLRTMQQSLDATNKTLHESLQSNSTSTIQVLQENSKQLHERLEKTAEVMRQVNLQVGQMSEIGRSMRELQEFLKSPKLRGNIGEQVLKDLLMQVFPKNSFHLQYQFRTGDKVDAAIQTDAGILPIDAKFPMEVFQRLQKAKSDEEIAGLKKEFKRNIKTHIDATAKKYILPEENTLDFALMYVPSESVFYEIVNMDDVLEYARNQRVYIVSPSTLYAHLQTILLSFTGKKIENHSREMFQLLRGLQTDYDKVSESFEVLGKHIGNASNQYLNVNKGFGAIGQKLSTATLLGEGENRDEKSEMIDDR